MNAEAAEFVPVLADATLDSLEEVAWDPVTRALVEAALEGREMVEDILRRLPDALFAPDGKPGPQEWVERLARDGPPVVLVPYLGRFQYSWVVVSLGSDPGTVRGPLERGLALTPPDRTGLVLSRRALAVPPHVDQVTDEVGGATRLSPAEFVQLARFVLRTLTPSRVLLATFGDAVLLDDALSRHTLALGVQRSLPRVAWGSKGSVRRHRARNGYLERLRMLRDLGPDAAIDRVAEQSLDGHVVRLSALRRAVVALAQGERRGLDGRLEEAGFEGSIVSLSDEAVASHLTPGQVSLRYRVDATPTAEAFETRVVELRVRPNATRSVLFACLHLLGDALCTTPLLREYRRRHPDDHVTFLVPDRSYARVFELSPDVDRLAFVKIMDERQLILLPSTPFLEKVPYFHGAFDERFVLDVQAVARTYGQQCHMAEGYARSLQMELTSRRPSLDVASARRHRPEWLSGQRYLVIARHTVSGASIRPRDSRTKLWLDSKWRTLCRRIRKELPLRVISIGTPGEARLEAPGVMDVHDLSILGVAGLLAGARSLLCGDNGIFHLGLAMGTPVVHLCPDWLGKVWTASCPEVKHRDLCAPLGRLPPDRVFRALIDLLHEVDGRCCGVARRFDDGNGAAQEPGPSVRS